MTRDRIVTLTILTACIFGFSIYMQKGTWVFPFPLYELAMLAAIVMLYIADKSRPQLPGILAFSWSLLQVGTSQFFHEFFFNDNNMRTFYESLFTDYLMIAFLLYFLVWGAVVSWKLTSQLWRILALICCNVFVVLFALNLQLWAIAPLILWLVSFFAAEKEASIHRNILFLFTFFFLSKYLTLAFMT